MTGEAPRSEYSPCTGPTVAEATIARMRARFMVICVAGVRRHFYEQRS